MRNNAHSHYVANIRIIREYFMESLIENFGLDWKLLLSQAVNFSLVFVILRVTVYTPLLQVMAKRKKKIEDGIMKDEEGTKRLLGIATLEKEKLKEAEAKALGIIHSGEEKAKKEGMKILEATAKKKEEMEVAARAQIEAEKQSALREAESQIQHLVKEVLVKAVSVKPESVDEALIKKVTEEVTHASR